MTPRDVVLVALVAAMAAGCTKRHVVRSAGGQVYVGRFIQARAYEAYARGSLAEAEGRLDDAAKSFKSATEFDGDGPEPWTRLGAVLCKQGDFEGGLRAFDKAADADSTFAGAQREKGRCLLGNGKGSRALEALELAAILDPADQDTLLLEVQALERLSRPAEAARLLLARALEPNPSPAVVDALARLANELHQTALARVASEARARSSAAQGDIGPAPKVTLADVDAALRRDDLRAARKLAVRAKTSQGELALRAAALGHRAVALEQATLVLDADPSDPGAAIALCVATDTAGFRGAVDRAAKAKLERSPELGKLAFAELVLRHDGADAARAMVSPEDLARPRADALEEAVRARLAKALSK